MSEHSRKPLQLIPKEIVSCNGKHYRISEILDFESLVAVDLETGRSTTLRINDLLPVDAEPLPSIEIEDISDAHWKTANKRYAAIKPLLEFGKGRAEVEERAKEIKVDFTTLYRWLKLYHNAGSIEGLIPEKPGRKKGSKRLSTHVEAIIQDVINQLYLTKQRSSAQKVVQEVRRRCMEEKLPTIPHANTIRSRIHEISEFEKLSKRGMREHAIQKLKPVPGKFPNADYPLSYVQIDHTPVDIILVDDTHRLPIGRPWITVAIDIYSRMVTGYYLSFDAPSATSVAMCVINSILPKDEWMALHDVDAQWPAWGIMDAIHVDNGADFRSEAFTSACMMHNIRLEYRPVRQPRYGGHIERYLGTLMEEIHNVPGTTFSSVQDRKKYDSDKNAILTISELERWFVTLISKVYHKRLHSHLGMPPEKKWNIGIFGNQEIDGRGIPSLPSNRFNMMLDFLPKFERTVQRYGISINKLTYYSDVLRPWVNAKHPTHKNKKREFICRRDPRDISVIWFYDPNLKQYFKIPFADQALPSMSIWEYNLAKEKNRKEGIKEINEYSILSAINELREQVAESAAKTKKARRMNQKIKEHKNKITPIDPLKNKKSEEPENTLSDNISLLEDDIDAFGDIS